MGDNKNFCLLLIIWGAICLLPIPLAGILPTHICSVVYAFLWLGLAYLFLRVQAVAPSKKNKAGAILMSTFYFIRCILVILQISGNLKESILCLSIIGIVSVAICLIGLALLCLSHRDKLFRLLLFLGGFSMVITPFATYSMGLGVISGNTFLTIVSISGIASYIFFIIAIICGIIKYRKY